MKSSGDLGPKLPAPHSFSQLPSLQPQLASHFPGQLSGTPASPLLFCPLRKRKMCHSGPPSRKDLWHEPRGPCKQPALRHQAQGQPLLPRARLEARVYSPALVQTGCFRPGPPHGPVEAVGERGLSVCPGFFSSLAQVFVSGELAKKHPERDYLFQGP